MGPGLDFETLRRLLEMATQLQSRPSAPANERVPGFLQPPREGGFTSNMPIIQSQSPWEDRGFYREAPAQEREFPLIPDTVLQNIARLLQRGGR